MLKKMVNNKTIITYEHDKIKQCLTCECDKCNNICKCKCNNSHFEELKKYCRAEFDYGLTYNYKEQCINIRKYTGLFQLKDGTYVEILPKINKKSEVEGRQIFYNLITASHNIEREFKQASNTNINVENTKLLEIMISIFCENLKIIMQKGLKKSYTTKQENLPFFKGKLHLTEHIRKNFLLKEKFFVEYDEFSENIAENRILKSACLYLLKETKDDKNKKNLRKMIVFLDTVDECINLNKDENIIKINRLHSYYESPINFAKFFLRRKNFTPIRGNVNIPTLLFPLEKMYEDYVESILREKFKNTKRQFSPYYLVKAKGKNIFNTQMDFVILNDNETTAIIIDAKWKLFNENDIENNYNIVQTDLYQLFTYSKILKQQKNLDKVAVVLVYPKWEHFVMPKELCYFDDTKIMVLPVDILDKSNNKLFLNSIINCLN